MAINKRFKRTLNAHRRQMIKHNEAYLKYHREEDFAKGHYHFHVIDNMEKKKRVLSPAEKREIYRIKTDPRYR